MPDEEELGDVVDAGVTEAYQIVEGEVVGDGDNEEKRGSGARIWKQRMRRTPEKVCYASAFGELRVRIWDGRSSGGGELGDLECERLFGVHRVDSEEEHVG